METLLDQSGQGRLAKFLDRIGETLGHERRRASFATYALGLLSDAERKSTEPIAARSCADVEQVGAIHQQLQHFLVDSRWIDHEVRLLCARYAIEAMIARGPIETWQIDDTGFLKQGKHSVGVQRQYTGSAGKIANCQIGVSLTVATRTDQIPIDFELYLPKSWTKSRELREEAHIPEGVTFKTKIEQACEMIRRAVADDIPRGVVLADSFYGDEPSFRAAVRAQGLQYAVGIKSDNRVWKLDKRGRRCGQPLTVAQLARSLESRASRRLTWLMREALPENLSRLGKKMASVLEPSVWVRPLRVWPMTSTLFIGTRPDSPRAWLRDWIRWLAGCGGPSKRRISGSDATSAIWRS